MRDQGHKHHVMTARGTGVTGVSGLSRDRPGALGNTHQITIAQEGVPDLSTRAQLAEFPLAEPRGLREPDLLNLPGHCYYNGLNVQM